jgi:hypothetical protein
VCAGLSPCEEGPLEGSKSWFCMMMLVEGEAVRRARSSKLALVRRFGAKLYLVGYTQVCRTTVRTTSLLSSSQLLDTSLRRSGSQRLQRVDAGAERRSTDAFSRSSAFSCLICSDLLSSPPSFVSCPRSSLGAAQSPPFHLASALESSFATCCLARMRLSPCFTTTKTQLQPVETR